MHFVTDVTRQEQHIAKLCGMETAFTDTSHKNKEVVKAFIEQVWNTGNTAAADLFLSHDYTDYSLPSPLPPNASGTKRWIEATGQSFQHHTTIEDMVGEDDSVIIRITMKLKHIGAWRSIEPTGIELTTVGYRHFKVDDGKIVAHWALIDGNIIENALKNASHGCAI